MPSLVEAFEASLRKTRQAFTQGRSFSHARRLAYGFAVAWGRRTVSRALCATNEQFRDWSASYRFFSRSPWAPEDVFQPMLVSCLEKTEGTFVVAMDDTTCRKTGRRIPGAGYVYDASSPPFARSFMRAQRFIQASAILRPEAMGGPARAIPLRFHPAPPAKKPRKKADDAAWAAYREAQKTQNLSMKGVDVICDLRACMDRAGFSDRPLLMAVDGSYCNRNVFRHLPDRATVVARARGDIRLYRPLSDDRRDRRHKYGEALPRPKELLADTTVPWRTASIFGAGRLHSLNYKVMGPVLWRSGSKDQPLRLFVIRPLRYRPRIGARLLYRDPAFLLTTDLTSPEDVVLQAYFDRWEIEVNHRDEKDLLGVGQAQVWSPKAAWRVPQFQVAVYTMLLLASLEAYGPRRTDAYLPLPKWRKQEARRPSTLDILALFREELMQTALTTVRVSHDTRPDGLTRHRHAPRATRPLSPADPITAALYASG